jgi:GTP-binding protein LepA
MDRIRNFSIIAHIDHGKSTLADRILEITGSLKRDKHEEQFLDSMELEREHGITIKAHHVRLNYKAENGNNYILNLIDTPGHVDFSYEVSRSMGACEGAVLLVDGTQGVEAQTISNLYQAVDNNLEIIPVINKIDLPGCDIEKAEDEIIELLGSERDEILKISAKTGEGVKEVIEQIIRKIPPPETEYEKPLKALIFDSIYNQFRGAIPYIRIYEGIVKKGDIIKFIATEEEYQVNDIGLFTIPNKSVSKLSAGEVGYLIGEIKNLKDIHIGDTVIHSKVSDIESLPGYKKIIPLVFSAFYPSESEDYGKLGEALDKLSLNDASLFYEKEVSEALGFGYRCGFLGLLHMQIIQERLEREYNLNLIATMPNVTYRVKLKDKTIIEIDSPSKLPDPSKIECVLEPYARVDIITPNEYLSNIIKLSLEKRGVQLGVRYITKNTVSSEFEFPLSEIIFNFYDKLKSVTRGYASMEYYVVDYRESQLEKLDILVNGKKIDSLSTIVHKNEVYHIGQKIVSKLKQEIPRQMFEVIIQASISKRVISRAVVKALRKNVTAKCYGGDISRKRKLLEKQKAGKKRMKQVGKVEIPQNAFLVALNIER